jgi:hypothetical protein
VGIVRSAFRHGKRIGQGSSAIANRCDVDEALWIVSTVFRHAIRFADEAD